MKKFLLAFVCLFTVLGNSISLKANEKELDLTPYLEIIEQVNKAYNVEYFIFSEEDYKNTLMYEEGSTYENYLLKIKSMDLNVFYTLLIDGVDELKNENLEIKLSLSKSTKGTKTIKFNSNKNSMTLTYKYDGNTFDASYTPSVKVNIINKKDYFKMQDYTGTFKNSNTTYSVKAEGYIVNNDIVGANKTFTVNFNL